jgi:hypothetical protein
MRAGPVVVDRRGPADDLPACEDHPHDRPDCCAPGANFVRQGPPTGVVVEQRTSGGQGGQERVEQRPPVDGRRAGELVETGPHRLVGPGPGHVHPDAHHDRVETPPAELCLRQHPGELPAVRHEIVGPLQRGVDAGLVPAGVRGGQGDGAGAEVKVARVAGGPEQHRCEQVRTPG